LDTLGGSAIAAVRNSVRVARRVVKFMVGRRGSRRLLSCIEGWFGIGAGIVGLEWRSGWICMRCGNPLSLFLSLSHHALLLSAL
jgi:hypothetical protein